MIHQVPLAVFAVRGCGTWRAITVLLLVLFCRLSSPAADTLRIATYNLLNYPGLDGPQRDPYFRVILSAMNPDVIVVQEMQSQAGVDEFLNNVLNYASADYTAVPFHDGRDTDNAFFYRTSKVRFFIASYIATDLRDIGEYYFKDAHTADTLRVFSLHLKASYGSVYEQQRFAEASTLRDNLNNLPPDSKFIIAGDYNVYDSNEPALIKLTENEVNNIGRAKDPLGAAGHWSGNYSYRFVHTQSPRLRYFGDGTGGGMNDRFDILLTSASSLDGNIILPSYTVYGNDGMHFNDSINRLPNGAVPAAVANALNAASDHLPVYCDFAFGSPNLATTQLQLGAGWNLVSLPVASDYRTVRDLFPDAISKAVGFGPPNYQVVDTMEYGAGYWLRFPASVTIPLTGLIRATDTIAIHRGWNLVGTLTTNVSAGSLVTNPPGLLCSVFMTYVPYFGRYFREDILEPGKGYWVKACGEGIMIIGH